MLPWISFCTLPGLSPGDCIPEEGYPSSSEESFTEAEEMEEEEEVDEPVHYIIAVSQTLAVVASDMSLFVLHKLHQFHH